MCPPDSNSRSSLPNHTHSDSQGYATLTLTLTLTLVPPTDSNSRRFLSNHCSQNAGTSSSGQDHDEEAAGAVPTGVMVSDEMAGEAMVVWAAARVGPGTLSIDNGWGCNGGGGAGSGGSAGGSKGQRCRVGMSSVEEEEEEEEEAATAWNARFKKEAVISPERDWRPFPHIGESYKSVVEIFSNFTSSE